MTEEEWDAVIKVHLKGTFAPSHHAAGVLARAGQGGRARNDARIINTTSVSGIYGNAGQTNYGAAKAGIAAFTLIAADGARPLRRHGERHRPRRAHADDRGPRRLPDDRRAASSPAGSRRS